MSTEEKIVNRFKGLALSFTMAGLFASALSNPVQAANHKEFEHRVMLGVNEHCMIDNNGNLFDLGENVEVVPYEVYETCVWLANEEYPEEIIDFCKLKEVTEEVYAFGLFHTLYICGAESQEIYDTYKGHAYEVYDNLFGIYKVQLNTHWSEIVEDDDVISYWKVR